MKNIPERQKDILSIISSLDISPTMYKNAVEKYSAITKFLNDYGIDADMYPQGSFAFGTVIRPNATDPSASYDLDFICQVRGSRVDYTPSELRQIIEDALSSSGIYGGKLTIYKECFTIEYADINDIGFTIDIVPATDETVENKNRLIKKSLEPDLIETAIAIPKHNGERNYSWLTNNPKGLRAWFDAKNEPFLTASRSAYRERLFAANRVLFASVEEIPHELDRSALQRVIQILKYHRDVFYAKIKDGDEIKPISAIINVVTTQIASRYDPNCWSMCSTNLTSMPGSKLSHLRILRRYMVAAPFSLVQTENGTYQTRLTLRTTWQISGIKMNGFRHISSVGLRPLRMISLNLCSKTMTSGLGHQLKTGLETRLYLLSWVTSTVIPLRRNPLVHKAQQSLIEAYDYF